MQDQENEPYDLGATGDQVESIANLVIWVPQVGHLARSMVRPLTVFSIVTRSSVTTFFSLHLAQNNSSCVFQVLLVLDKGTPESARIVVEVFGTYV
jgi:hypothetical protein